MNGLGTTVFFNRRSYRLALATCIAVVSFLAFAPLVGPVLTSNDKVNHLAAFFVLAWLAEGAYPGPDLAATRWGLLVFYALLIEMIQYHLPYRNFSLSDLAADVAAILAYVVLAHLATRLTWVDSHRRSREELRTGRQSPPQYDKPGAGRREETG